MKDGNILPTEGGDLDYTLNELGKTRGDILFMGTKAQEKFGPEAQQFKGAIDEVQPAIDDTVKEIYTGNLSDEDSVVPFPEASAQIKDYLEGSGLNLPDQRDPGSVNAGEAALIQEVLGRLTFDENNKLVAKDPNFIEKVLGQIVNNFTLGMIDINQMDKDQVQAFLDAYKETGQFAYDDSNQVVGVIDADGNVVSYGPGYEMTESGVERMDDVDIFGEGDSVTVKNYTMDSDGAIVCNNEGYVYNSETDMCEPPVEKEGSDTVSFPTLSRDPYRSFEDIMASITTPAPTIAPISANIGKMQGGGMAGLNRAADNFLKALAG
jgi:YD repeat-containing protein